MTAVTTIGVNIETSPAIKNYIESKIKSIHLPDSFGTLEFRISKDGHQKQVNFFGRERGHEYHISETHDDLYTAIDSIMPKITRAVHERHDKDKQVSRRKSQQA